MPDAPAILTEVLDGGVALIRLNRPEVLKRAQFTACGGNGGTSNQREGMRAVLAPPRSFVDKAPPGVSAFWQEAMDMIAERPNQRRRGAVGVVHQHSQMRQARQMPVLHIEIRRHCLLGEDAYREA